MKKIFLFLMALFAINVANAQIATEESKLTDNVYAGIGGQVSTPLDFNGVFPLNGGATLIVGKDFTPVWGVNIEGTAWFGSHSNGGDLRFDSNVAHNIVRGSYVGLNTTTNLTNLFHGYAGSPRKTEIQTVVGIGWVHTYVPNMSDKSHNDLGAKTGVNINFNFGVEKQHTLFIQPSVLWNLTTPGCDNKHIAFNKNGAQLALTVGYAYHFKTSNGTHYFKTYDIGVLNDDINRLKSELAAKPKEIVRQEIKTVEVVRTIESKYVINFAQNKYELTDDAKRELDKIEKGNKVVVEATASPEGTEKHNIKLSQQRADSVADYLKSNGVEVLNSKGLGVTGSDSQRTATVILK